MPKLFISPPKISAVSRAGVLVAGGGLGTARDIRWGHTECRNGGGRSAFAGWGYRFPPPSSSSSDPRWGTGGGEGGALSCRGGCGVRIAAAGPSAGSPPGVKPHAGRGTEPQRFAGGGGGAQRPLGGVKTSGKGQILSGRGGSPPPHTPTPSPDVVSADSDAVLPRQKPRCAVSSCPDSAAIPGGGGANRGGGGGFWEPVGTRETQPVSFGKRYRHGEGGSNPPPTLPSSGTALLSGRRAFLLPFFPGGHHSRCSPGGFGGFLGVFFFFNPALTLFFHEFLFGKRSPSRSGGPRGFTAFAYG